MAAELLVYSAAMRALVWRGRGCARGDVGAAAEFLDAEVSCGVLGGGAQLLGRRGPGALRSRSISTSTNTSISIGMRQLL